MAIYHLSVKIGSRRKGQSAVHAAAYRAGERLEDKYDDSVADYTHKGGVVFSEIAMPEKVAATHPEYKDRQTLWNAVEANETKQNSRLYREFECALPKELNREQRIAVAREFVSSLVAQGMIVDWSMHEPDTGTQNYHIHAMTPCRACDPETGNWITGSRTKYAEDKDGNKIPVIDPETGKQKVRIREGKGSEKLWVRESVPGTGWDTKANMQVWRQAWEDAVNNGLDKAGREERVSRLSLQAQGIERVPQIHEGVAAKDIAKKQKRGKTIPFSYKEYTEKSVVSGFEKLKRYLENILPVFRKADGVLNKIGMAVQHLIEKCSHTLQKTKTQGVTRKDVNELIKARNRTADLIDAQIKEMQDELAELQNRKDRDAAREQELYERLEQLRHRRADIETARRDAERDRKVDRAKSEPAEKSGREGNNDSSAARQNQSATASGSGLSQSAEESHHRRR